MKLKMRKVLLVALTSLVALASITLANELGIWYSGEVKTVTVAGSVKVSDENSTTADWVDSMNVTPGQDWFARYETEATGYIGAVNITWVLQEKNGTWSDTAHNVTTIGFSLNGNVQYIYASADGLIGSNKNWGVHTNTTSTWRIEATFED